MPGARLHSRAALFALKGPPGWSQRRQPFTGTQTEDSGARSWRWGRRARIRAAEPGGPWAGKEGPLRGRIAQSGFQAGVGGPAREKGPRRKTDSGELG